MINGVNWRRKNSKFVDGCFEIIDRSRPLQTWSLSAKWMFKMITLFHSVIFYWETRPYQHQHDFCSYCTRIWGIFYSYDWNCGNICSCSFYSRKVELHFFSLVYLLLIWGNKRSVWKHTGGKPYIQPSKYSLRNPNLDQCKISRSETKGDQCCKKEKGVFWGWHHCIEPFLSPFSKMRFCQRFILLLRSYYSPELP